MNRVTAPVVDRSYLGDHVRYRVRLGDSTLTVQTSDPIDRSELVLGFAVDRTLAFAGGASDA